MGYVIGIDVGTSGVRGALVTENGRLERISNREIKTWNPKPKFYQQSSDEIWSACCSVTQELIKDISPHDIKGIGFDATCSLVVLDQRGNPISVNDHVDELIRSFDRLRLTNVSPHCSNVQIKQLSPSTDKDVQIQNIILWMDHRAQRETELINKTRHPLFKNSGGSISIESMIPKLLWLKNFGILCWKKIGHLFLLPDFLTWKATGETKRSLCCVIGKCNYECSPEISRWNEDFFGTIGLGELTENNWKKIGSEILKPGEICGMLKKSAAQEMGLIPNIPVAVSMIDAHAGGIGVMGCHAENISSECDTRIGIFKAMICGTSTCHMTQTKKEIYVHGIWGPYYNVMIPNKWLLAGGQTVSGKLIDHVIDMHSASNSIRRKSNIHITEYLNNLLEDIAKKKQLNCIDELTKHVHVWPDFHGNRSPIADPSLRGMIQGLKLTNNEEDLAIMYLATIQALAYNTKFIIETMKDAGHDTIKSIIMCGGLTKNQLFVKTHADIIGLPVLIPEQTESVLLGAAMLAASAAGIYDNLEQAMVNMAGAAKLQKPRLQVQNYHKKKYRVFMELLKHQNRCREIMKVPELID